MVLCGENMVSRKSKIVCLVKVSSAHCGPVSVKFYKLSFAERKITKLDLKSTMCSVVKCPRIFFFHTIVFNIFWVFNNLYLLN